MGLEVRETKTVEPNSTRHTGVRFYTREPVTLSWLARSIVPVARGVSDQTGAVFLRRGWLHGPHVDIVAPHADGPGVAWQEIAETLDAGPLRPEKALSEEAYLAQARELGRLEAVPPPYLPLAEHGAVELLTASDVGSREPRLDRLRETVLGVIAPPLMRMIEDLSADSAQATARLAEAFVALADTHALGAAYGVFSLRSHAEAFLSWAAASKDIRPAFATRLAAERADLRTVVEQRLAGEPSPTAAQWRTAFAYCAGALDNAVATGTLTLELLESVTAGIDTAGMGPPGAEDTVPEGDHPDSEFHRTVHSSGVVDTPSPWFAAYRLLTNLFYEQLPLLTVSPLQRYYMCYAIAETVDEVLGESWRDRLRAQQARRGAVG